MATSAQPPGGGQGGGGSGRDVQVSPAGEPERRGLRPDLLTLLFIRLRDLLFPKVRNAVVFVSRERAQDAAGGRLAAIREHRNRPWGRFAEIPPGTLGVHENDDESFGEAQDQLLEWQTQAPELLLLARAADAALALVRARDREDSPAARGQTAATLIPLVAIKPLPKLLARLRPQLFPWRVVITTPDPDALHEDLARLSGWLGVGVDIERGSRLEALARCLAGGGREGVVGGTVRDSSGQELRLTCAHVLAPDCVSAVWRPQRAGLPHEGVCDEPDAALLSAGACLAADCDHAVELRCASYAQLKELVRSGRPVRRIGGAHSGTQGIVHLAPDAQIDSPAAMLAADGLNGVTRFPLVVLTRRRRRFRLNRRPFSSEGDSGSWVVDGEERCWVGMLVSGNEDLSLALSACNLVTYLANLNPSPLAEGDLEWLTTLS